jgi:cell division protein FtsB
MIALAPTSKPDGHRPAGPEPLRRKRVQPTPAPTPPWRRRALNYLLIFVVVVLVVDGLVGENGLMQRLRARESYQEQRLAFEALRQENQRLRGQIHRLREDPGTIEALAREELGLIRPGEILFMIRDVKPASR